MSRWLPLVFVRLSCCQSKPASQQRAAGPRSACRDQPRTARSRWCLAIASSCVCSKSSLANCSPHSASARAQCRAPSGTAAVGRFERERPARLQPVAGSLSSWQPGAVLAQGLPALERGSHSTLRQKALGQALERLGCIQALVRLVYTHPRRLGTSHRAQAGQGTSLL